MMNSLVTDFSGTYAAQDFLPWLEAQPGRLDYLDFKGLEGCCCYCTAVEEIDAVLPERLPRLRWLDSGDYHYMTYLLARREKEPFSLLLLDNHPDNQPPAFGDVLSCGSWVPVLARDCAALQEVLTIGPEQKRCPAGWAKGKRVYLSLDKDILARDWARTDWSQGEMTLETLKDIIRTVAEEGELVAADICGELSEGKGATPEDLRINRETNIELYKLITTYLK